MGKGSKRKGNKTRVPQKVRKKLVEEVFKKGKKQRDIAKRLDDKISRKQLKAGGKRFKKNNKAWSVGNLDKAHAEWVLDKKLTEIRKARKPPPKHAKEGPVNIKSAIDCLTRMRLD